MLISGQSKAMPLTQDGALRWRMVQNPYGGDEWRLFTLSHPVRTSPDGRWIAFSQRGPYLFIVDAAAQRPPIRLEVPAPSAVAWAPDSRSLAFTPPYGSPSLTSGLTTYDLLTGEQETLVASYEEGIHNLVWSPDGRHIAFACCFEEDEDGLPSTSTGQIQRVEVATKEVETVGTARASVAGGVSQLCWTSGGEVRKEEEVEMTNQVTCSYQHSQITRAASPDGMMRAVVSLSSPDQTLPDTVIVRDARTEEVIWQRDLGMPVTAVRWSPAGDYLLLDNSEAESPIWRIKADGTEDAEVIVEDGYLLDVLPAYP